MDDTGTKHCSGGCSPTDTGIEVKTNQFGNFHVTACGGRTRECPRIALARVEDLPDFKGKLRWPTDPDLELAVERALEQEPELLRRFKTAKRYRP